MFQQPTTHRRYGEELQGYRYDNDGGKLHDYLQEELQLGIVELLERQKHLCLLEHYYQQTDAHHHPKIEHEVTLY